MVGVVTRSTATASVGEWRIGPPPARGWVAHALRGRWIWHNPAWTATPPTSQPVEMHRAGSERCPDGQPSSQGALTAHSWVQRYPQTWHW